VAAAIAGASASVLAADEGLLAGGASAHAAEANGSSCLAELGPPDAERTVV
jgi:hypothetical protein